MRFSCILQRWPAYLKRDFVTMTPILSQLAFSRTDPFETWWNHRILKSCLGCLCCNLFNACMCRRYGICCGDSIYNKWSSPTCVLRPFFNKFYKKHTLHLFLQSIQLTDWHFTTDQRALFKYRLVRVCSFFFTSCWRQFQIWLNN